MGVVSLRRNLPQDRAFLQPGDQTARAPDDATAAQDIAALSNLCHVEGDRQRRAEEWFPELARIFPRDSDDLDIFERFSPDRGLLDQFGPERCQTLGLMPLRRLGGATVFATWNIERARASRDLIPPDFGEPLFVSVPREAFIDQLCALRGRRLVIGAETRPRREDSCRSWRPLAPASVLLVAAGLLTALALSQGLALAGLVGTALLFMVVNTAFKSFVAAAALRGPRPPRTGRRPMHDAPKISLLIPLFHEAAVAGTLLRNLERLRYPRARLEVVFAVEAVDDLTKNTLSQLTLPDNFQIVEVPTGTIRTKPRALNFVLPFTDGDIIGIYDAEDRPEADQLLKVAETFAQSDDTVACLQGKLDFYNVGANVLSRCFTLEYAAWFNIILRGLAALGLPVPLGGTTLFVKRAALNAVGGWDAHNVTEDADLGLRLFRNGYRVALLDSTTHEEANCRVWPWVRQRSRWIKGYIVTYLVHMRRPRAALRSFGWRGFLAVQLLFLGAIIGALTAPALLIFWGLIFGLDVAGLTSISPGVLADLGLVFLVCEALNLAIWIAAAVMSRHARLLLWIPALHLYFFLASVAAMKALWELLVCPFYWDKTQHGVSR